MGVRHPKREELARLKSKTLEARFLQIVREGLGCSRFESQAVLEVVKEVWFPFLDAASPQAPPGKITLVAVCADEPPGVAVADCEKRHVCLTLHRGPEDDRLVQDEGPAGFRRARIPDLCQDALSQGALLTREDLAHRVFFVSTRTISRDLCALRRDDPDRLVPLRGAIRDIGPVLTHRTRIVELALEGKTTSQICDWTRHSPSAVANYLSTFARCAQLARSGMQVGQIAFLLRRGKSLVAAYLELLGRCERDKNMSYHLDEMLALAEGGKKKGGRGHGR
jgi:hypothetical protein